MVFTLTILIICFAILMSPWWFWPISAITKHGWSPPIIRPGAISNSSGIFTRFLQLFCKGRNHRRVAINDCFTWIECMTLTFDLVNKYTSIEGAIWDKWQRHYFARSEGAGCISRNKFCKLLLSFVISFKNTIHTNHWNQTNCLHFLFDFRPILFFIYKA